MAKIANVALTNTFDTWRVRSNQAFDRLSQFAIDNSKLYANTITANVRFVSSGATKLGSSGSTRTIVNGLLSGNGNINVSGNTVLGGASKTVTIGGAGATANATGWFGVTGRATISTNLFVGGNTTLNGTTTDKSNALNQTLTDAATINWDTSLGRVATVTLGASRTIAAATNQKVGTYILRVIQGGSGSYTLTWNGNYKWTAQSAPVLSTTVGAIDIFTFFSDGTKMYGSFIPDVR